MGLLFLCAALSVATTVAIVLSLVPPTIDFFGEVSIKEFLTGTKWSPLFANPRFGVLPLVAGTAVTTVCALAVCVPIGLGSAIYLSEYARPRTRQVLKPLLELLAGIPTVVYGYFALEVVSPIVQTIWPLGDPPGAFNALSAGIVMGVMIVPTVGSLSEDAMTAVPAGLREGAYALGSDAARGGDPRGRAGGPVRYRGVVRAGDLARRRRDDDRADRRRRPAEPGHQPR